MTLKADADGCAPDSVIALLQYSYVVIGDAAIVAPEVSRWSFDLRKL